MEAQNLHMSSKTTKTCKIIEIAVPITKTIVR